MLKVLLALLGLLKKALFKTDDEYKLNSYKFDAFKVSVFLFLVFTCIFNIFAFKTIIAQATAMDSLKQRAQDDKRYKNCVENIIKEAPRQALVKTVTAAQLLDAIQTCTSK